MKNTKLKIGLHGHFTSLLAKLSIGQNGRIKVDDYSHFFLFVFLRDQNCQHFNEDLLAVNASAFSFVLCFKVINCTGASNYAIIAN